MKRLATVTFFVGLIGLHLYLPLGARSNVSTFRLSNGLRVILSPVDNIEAACVLLYHLTGVRDDPPEVRGGSYLYQNLMLLGTRHLDVYDRVVFIKRWGGTGNRMVTYDRSIFYQVIPEFEINNALWLESERIGSLKLTDRSITLEKNQVYTKNYRSLHSNVEFRAMRWMESRVFEGSIYEMPVYGNLEEVRKFNNQAIKKLYNNFKDLSKIIMVITGKFDGEELKKSIIKHFGGLSSPTPAKTAREKYPSINPRTTYVFDNWLVANLQEPFVLYGIRTPSKFSKDYLYFDFIRSYLVDPRISKLEKVLNKDNRLNAAISHHYTDHFASNALIIKISAKPRANLERAKYFVNKELAALQKGRPGTISNTEVKVTKSLMEIDFMKKMSKLEERSIFLAENYHISGQLDTEEKYLKDIRSISVYDIYRVARKYLEKNNRVNLNVYSKQQ